MSQHTSHVTRYKFMSQVTCQVKSPCYESTIACYMSQHTSHMSQDTSSCHKLHVKSKVHVMSQLLHATQSSHVTRYKFPCYESQVTCQVTNHVTCNMSWATIHRSQVKSRVKKSTVNHTRRSVTSHVTN